LTEAQAMLRHLRPHAGIRAALLRLSAGDKRASWRAAAMPCCGRDWSSEALFSNRLADMLQCDISL
jgi:hypothetical protein